MVIEIRAPWVCVCGGGGGGREARVIQNSSTQDFTSAQVTLPLNKYAKTVLQI